MSKVVSVIPAKPVQAIKGLPFQAKKRVCAYCRVSTDMEEQLSSYEAQVTYYEDYIKKRPDWEFAGIYADEYNLRLIQFDTETAVKPHKITALGAKRQTESRYFCFMEI